VSGFRKASDFALRLPHSEADKAIGQRIIGRRRDALKLTSDLYEALTVPSNRRRDCDAAAPSKWL
jgi:hypothetical protein